MLSKAQHSLLFGLLAQPTAPFREHHPKSYVTDWLIRKNIPFFLDPIGNVVVGVADERDYRRVLRQRTTNPLRLFIAHLDHPGFHGQRWLGANRLAVRWYGGSPTRHLNGASVWLATDDGEFATGRLARVKLASHGFGMETAEVVLPRGAVPAGRPTAKRIYGAFSFRASRWQSGDRVYARVADDYIGVFCALEAALAASRNRSGREQRYIGLLTRAEEVGFVGAVGHFDLGWLDAARRPVWAVSLEASRTLPRADIGKGPVVRLGDRRTVFSADALQALTHLAERTLKQNFQRRIMDGGACEGTAATVFGLPTLGISIPLGNYHNQGFEGGQDCRKPGGPAPEFVHVRDIAAMASLCRAIVSARFPEPDPWQKVRNRLRKNFRSMKSLL